MSQNNFHWEKCSTGFEKKKLETASWDQRQIINDLLHSSFYLFYGVSYFIDLYR
jgi:hypothetical protein